MFYRGLPKKCSGPTSCSHRKASAVAGKLRRRFPLILGLMTLISPVEAEVVALTDASSFSGNALRMVVELEEGAQLALLGAKADKIFEKWGVVLNTLPGSTLVVKEMPVTEEGEAAPDLPVFIANLLDNETLLESEYPLIVTFSIPVSRVLFQFLGAPVGSRLNAFSLHGELLGSIATDEEFLDFYGVESTEQPISRVVIEFGEEDVERLVGITLDFADGSHSFEMILPHWAAGELEGTAIESITAVTNLSNLLNEVELEVRNEEGTVVSLGPRSNPISMQLQPFASGQFKINANLFGTRELMKGYVLVRSSQPVAVSMTSSTRSKGRVIQAGINGDQTDYTITAFAEYSDHLKVDTGLAIVNTGSETSMLQVEFISNAGDHFTGKVLLAGGFKQTLFVSELFPEIQESEEDHLGTLLLRSSSPFSAAVLRTVGGVAVASLPIGRLQNFSIKQ